jgi:hypothetical protein
MEVQPDGLVSHVRQRTLSFSTNRKRTAMSLKMKLNYAPTEWNVLPLVEVQDEDYEGNPVFKDGQPVMVLQPTKREETQDERMSHIVPPPGFYDLKVNGIATPFEMARSEVYGGGVQTMTRLLCEIQGGKGHGKEITLLLGWSLGARSNMTKVFKAVLGDRNTVGEIDLADLLNGQFNAYLEPSEDKWDDGRPKGTRCTWATVKPVGGPGGEEVDEDALWGMYAGSSATA